MQVQCLVEGKAPRRARPFEALLNIRLPDPASLWPHNLPLAPPRPEPQSSQEQCCDACRTTEGCNVWVFCAKTEGTCEGNRKPQECWLKKKQGLNVLKPAARRTPGAGELGWRQLGVCAAGGRGG